MNVFYLSHDQKQNAEWHVDSHVLKMILEYTQLLCSAYYLNPYMVHRVSDPENHRPSIWVARMSGESDFRVFGKTHFNHPCAIWVRHSIQNWLWLRDMAIALCAEFEFRRGREHATLRVLKALIPPDLISDNDFTAPPLAMPDEFKVADAIESYRCYYRFGKKHLHVWTNRPTPDWILS